MADPSILLTILGILATIASIDPDNFSKWLEILKQLLDGPDSDNDDPPVLPPPPALTVT